MENSQFSFHLDRLITDGHVQKEEDLYKLTTLGKEYANRYDSDSKVYKKQGKISVWIAASRGEDNKEYLIYTRLKNPVWTELASEYLESVFQPVPAGTILIKPGSLNVTCPRFFILRSVSRRTPRPMRYSKNGATKHSHIEISSLYRFEPESAPASFIWGICSTAPTGSPERLVT